MVDTRYKKGKFINAMKHDEASTDNESNTIVLAEPKGDRPVAVVKQIVGLIARRIICTVRPGDVVGRGERIGMIKFGSRTELYLPKWLEPTVKVSIGQSVRGASDVVAVLGKAIHTERQDARRGDRTPGPPRDAGLTVPGDGPVCDLRDERVPIPSLGHGSV